MVEGEAVEREREEGGVADEVAEARSRQAGGTLELEATDLARLLRLRELGRLAEAADLDGVVLGVAVGCRLVRRVGDDRKRLVASGLGGRELLLCGSKLLLQLLQLLELLGRRLALELRAAAQIVDPGHERAPALVGREQGVERLAGSLARERSAPRVRLGSGCLEIDHATDSR